MKFLLIFFMILLTSISFGQYSFYGAAIDLKTGKQDTLFPDFEGPVTNIISDGDEGYFVVTHHNIIIDDISYIEGVVYNLKKDYSINRNWSVRTNHFINAIAVWNNTIFIAGSFSMVNSQTQKGFAVIDITNGEILRGGDSLVDGPIYSLFIHNETLYIGGIFERIKGIPRKNLAAFSLETGELLNWNPTVNGGVTFIGIHNEYLVAGGNIIEVNSKPRLGIAFINLANAHVTDWNVNVLHTVRKFIIHNDMLYIGGSFLDIQGKGKKYLTEINLNTREITDWNIDLSSEVWDMELHDSLLIIGGSFANLGRLVAVNVYTKKLTKWKVDLNDEVRTLHISNGKLLLGGLFTIIHSSYQSPFPEGSYLSQNYPNPFNGRTTIQYKLPVNDFVNIKIFDLLGKEVRTLVDEYKSSGEHQIELNSMDLSSGVYMYRISTSEFNETKKLLILK